MQYLNFDRFSKQIYFRHQGGIQTWTDYPYCCGIGGGPGSCFPCPAPGYNRTLCGPPAEYCLKNESCNARINPSRFVPGLRVSDWQAVSQVGTKASVCKGSTNILNWSHHTFFFFLVIVFFIHYESSRVV